MRWGWLEDAGGGDVCLGGVRPRMRIRIVGVITGKAGVPTNVVGWEGWTKQKVLVVSMCVLAVAHVSTRRGCARVKLTRMEHKRGRV